MRALWSSILVDQEFASLRQVTHVQMHVPAQVYPGKKRFETEKQQSDYVHKWLDDAGLGEEGAKVNLVFYKGRYHSVSTCLP